MFKLFRNYLGFFFVAKVWNGVGTFAWLAQRHVHNACKKNCTVDDVKIWKYMYNILRKSGARFLISRKSTEKKRWRKSIKI